MAYSLDDLMPDADAPAVRLGTAIRRLAVTSVNADAKESVVADVAAMVEVATAILEQQPTRPPLDFSDLDIAKRAAGLFNPVIGWANPSAPPVHMTFEPDGTAIASVVMRRIFEGPPGCVHGGWVAMMLDQTLGHANAAAGIGAFTAEIAISYKQPTPFDVPLTITARTQSVEGRKVRTRGEVVANGTVTAVAEGLFIKWDA